MPSAPAASAAFAWAMATAVPPVAGASTGTLPPISSTADAHDGVDLLGAQREALARAAGGEEAGDVVAAQPGEVLAVARLVERQVRREVGDRERQQSAAQRVSELVGSQRHGNVLCDRAAARPGGRSARRWASELPQARKENGYLSKTHSVCRDASQCIAARRRAQVTSPSRMRPICASTRRSIGLRRPRAQMACSSTGRPGPRYRRGHRRRRRGPCRPRPATPSDRADAGTRAHPRPAATSRTAVRIWCTCCSTLGCALVRNRTVSSWK